MVGFVTEATTMPGLAHGSALRFLGVLDGRGGVAAGGVWRRVGWGTRLLQVRMEPASCVEGLSLHRGKPCFRAPPPPDHGARTASQAGYGAQTQVACLGGAGVVLRVGRWGSGPKPARSSCPAAPRFQQGLLRRTRCAFAWRTEAQQREC